MTSATCAACPPLSTFPISISEWAAVGRDSIVGKFSLTLQPMDLTICGCLLRQAAGLSWVTMPASLIYVDGGVKRGADGRLIYRNLIRFKNKNAFRRFQTPILEELKRLGHIEG